jgi:hypothetical protein
MNRLAVALPALILLAIAGEARACACCTNQGQRYVEVEALDSMRREQIESVRFAKQAQLFVGEAGVETVEGIATPAERYELEVTWTSDRVAFALTDDQGHGGTLTLAIPAKISVFEIDPRDGSDQGLGPVLYKEWKITGKASGTGVFAAGSGSGQLLTLILQGRGIGCTSADHFGYWTLVMQGPNANYHLFGDLVRTQ